MLLGSSWLLMVLLHGVSQLVQSASQVLISKQFSKTCMCFGLRDASILRPGASLQRTAAPRLVEVGACSILLESLQLCSAWFWCLEKTYITSTCTAADAVKQYIAMKAFTAQPLQAAWHSSAAATVSSNFKLIDPQQTMSSACSEQPTERSALQALCCCKDGPVWCSPQFAGLQALTLLSGYSV